MTYNPTPTRWTRILWWLCDSAGFCLWALSKVKLWKRPRCSTGIHGFTTYGYGKLSHNGFWQFPVVYLENREYGAITDEDWLRDLDGLNEADYF